MNTQTLLTENQQTNRIAKGHEIYNNGLVEQLNPRLYIVKAKYEVEDLGMIGDITPYYKCSCPDHTYRDVKCCHIYAVTFYQMDL
jgi:uncharacterized Zn finger protein